MSQFATLPETSEPAIVGAAAFDAAFARRAPRLRLRPETSDDAQFLRELFRRCSALDDPLPPQLLDMQLVAQDSAYASAYPDAMRRIVSTDAGPIGRIIVDWTEAGVSQGLDIAVDPDHRSSGAGLHMLRAWLDAADTFGKVAWLTVRADNPARRIYERLGFQAAQPVGAYDLMVAMSRQPRRQ